eukprot:4452818-Prymnesium_polylepis.1
MRRSVECRRSGGRRSGISSAGGISAGKAPLESVRTCGASSSAEEAPCATSEASCATSGSSPASPADSASSFCALGRLKSPCAHCVTDCVNCSTSGVGAHRTCGATAKSLVRSSCISPGLLAFEAEVGLPVSGTCVLVTTIPRTWRRTPQPVDSRPWTPHPLWTRRAVS